MTTVTKDGLARLLGQNGDVLAKASEPEQLDADALRELFRWMLQQRLLDDLMLTLQRQGRIGFYGAATGQEAAVFGSGRALEARDWVLPALREGGVALMRGYPLVDYLAQCFGNSLDRSFGRQMPCHYGAAEQNYATLSSPIGNQLPQAVGVAMAMKARGDDAVCLGYIGDGGTSENDFHTALDLARRTCAPVVFVCQNNQWAISTPVMGQMASVSIAAKASAFRIPSVRVDGNDVLACYSVTREAVDRARGGGGPTFIEALTYRIGAHSSSDDPSRYRDESVTEKWKKRCPIARYRKFLVSAGHMTDAEVEALATDLGASIRETLGQVEAADKAPALSTMFDDVFADRPWFLHEQAAEADLYPPPGTL